MKGLQAVIIQKANDLPVLEEGSFFHSRELFSICEQVPRQKPLMVVAKAPDGRVVGHLLCVLRYRTSLLPPFFLIHCRVLGEGTYSEIDYPKEEVFGEMLHTLVSYLHRRSLYIEVSDLSLKMFGYRQFRQQKFFPVHWMSIHNSLHSRAPEERISKKLQQRIDNAFAKGVYVEEVHSDEDFKAFSKLLHQHHILKPKRYIPDDHFFQLLRNNEQGKLFVVKYHDHVIGCSTCVYSEGNAYLWYAAFRRKTYHHLHPDIITVWSAIKYAHSNGYQHIFFLDVGLPFSKNPYREFILRFGGKPVSTYRWFRVSIKWINSLLAWVYHE